MLGLTAAFSLPLMFSNIDKFVDNKEKELAEGLAFFGEQFVNDARTYGDYEDRTSNLRGSIAYDVVQDGRTLYSDYSGGDNSGEESKYYAEKAVDDVIMDEGMLTDGKMWLIGVAGMEYASPLESKGWDVITTSVPEFIDIKSFLKEAGLE